ncbi:hypothetical protein ACFWB2_40700 [Streptomyces virginiae]
MCVGPLADVMVLYGTHPAFRDVEGWTDCLGRPYTVCPTHAPDASRAA